MLCSLLTRVVSFIYYFVAGGFLGSDISFIPAARRLWPERAGDSDCCLSSIIRSVTWRRLSTRKGTGTVGAILQAFYWDCPKAENREHQWWVLIKSKLPSIAQAGFTALWLPPANKAAGSHKAVKPDRKSTRLNSSHSQISYAVFCLTNK